MGNPLKGTIFDEHNNALTKNSYVSNTFNRKFFNPLNVILVMLISNLFVHNSCALSGANSLIAPCT